MSRTKTVCGAWLPAHKREWVRDGGDVVESLAWLLEEAWEEGRAIKAYRVRPSFPSDIDAVEWPATGERVTVLPGDRRIDGVWVTVPLDERIMLEVKR